MFHIESYASKVSFCSLVKILREKGYQLLDVQWLTSHLVQFGAVEILQNEYLERLKFALKRECQFVDSSNAESK